MFLSNAHWYQIKCQLKNPIPTEIIASHIGKDCHLATKLAFRLVELPSTRIGTRVSEYRVPSTSIPKRPSGYYKKRKRKIKVTRVKIDFPLVWRKIKA